MLKVGDKIIQPRNRKLQQWEIIKIYDKITPRKYADTYGIDKTYYEVKKIGDPKTTTVLREQDNVHLCTTLKELGEIRGIQ